MVLNTFFLARGAFEPGTPPVNTPLVSSIIPRSAIRLHDLRTMGTISADQSRTADKSNRSNRWGLGRRSVMIIVTLVWAFISPCRTDAVKNVFGPDNSNNYRCGLDYNRLVSRHACGHRSDPSAL